MPPLGALKSVCVAPSSLPTSDSVVDEGGRAHGWKLKRQRPIKESVDHMFSLPWLLSSAVWVSL